MRPDCVGNLLRKPLAVNRQCRARGDAMRVGGAHHQRTEPPHLFLQQPDGVIQLVAAKRVGTDQFGEAVGLVDGGGSRGPHLVHDDAYAERGRLPGRFASGQAAADDVNHGTILRFDGLAAAAPRGATGRGCGARRAPAAASAARRGSGVAARLEQFHRLLDGQRFGIRSLGNGRVGGAVGDVGTIAPGKDAQLRLAVRDLLQHLFLRRLAAARLLRRANQRQCRIKRDVENVVFGFKRSEFVAVFDVRTKPPEVRGDRLVVVGMQSRARAGATAV